MQAGWNLARYFGTIDSVWLFVEFLFEPALITQLFDSVEKNKTLGLLSLGLLSRNCMTLLQAEFKYDGSLGERASFRSYLHTSGVWNLGFKA